MESNKIPGKILFIFLLSSSKSRFLSNLSSSRDREKKAVSLFEIYLTRGRFRRGLILNKVMLGRSVGRRKYKASMPEPILFDFLASAHRCTKLSPARPLPKSLLFPSASRRCTLPDCISKSRRNRRNTTNLKASLSHAYKNGL